MRKYNYRNTLWMVIALSLVFSLSLTSCLKENPKDQVDEESMYDTPQHLYVNAIATLYNYMGSSKESEGLQGTCRGVYDYNTLTTDEAIIPIRGGDWYDGGLWNAMYQHKWTPDDESLYDTWIYLYKVVLCANKSIDIINSHANILKDRERIEYLAEVRAIRAMFYYYLMDMYGRVPLMLSTSEFVENNAKESTPSELSNAFPSATNMPTQSERSQVFRFIFSELQSVVNDLSDAHSNKLGNNYGRVTQPVVNFLLAKLALNAEVYTDDDWTDGHRPQGKDIFFEVYGRKLNAWQTCEYYCSRLAAEHYQLEPNYADNFKMSNTESCENIFTIPMDKNDYGNQFHYLFRSYHYLHGAALGWGTENGTCATISTMKANHYGESDEDARCKINFVAGVVVVGGKVVYQDNGKPLEYQPWEVKQNLTNSPYIKTAGARMAKYEVDRTAYMDGRLGSNDIVLYRYADVLLMLAEAKLRNGEDGSQELNEVRARVGMPARACTLDNILEERLLELVWEGWRRQDLIRFGKFTQAYDLRTPIAGESSGFTTVFPIPQRSIDLNMKLVQNPGYDKKK